MRENFLRDSSNMVWLKKSESLYPILGFLLWPFGIMIESIRHWDRTWSKNVFWLYCVFFGFTFVIAEYGGADSDRYARQFIEFAHSNISLKELWSMFYTEGSGHIDIMSPLIMFFISRLTDNPAVLFVVFGAIIGYFYSRNIWYVLKINQGRQTLVIVLFFLTFVLINPIWNINAFRFSAAAQVFLYGTLPYLMEGKRKYLIWSGLSILVHFTFILPVGVLGLFIVIRNRLNIYLIFFIITSFIKEVDLQWIQSTFSFLPEIFFSEILTYTNAEYSEYRRIQSDELPWFITFASTGIRWAVYLIVLSTFFFGREIIKKKHCLKTLLSYALLLYGVANLVSLIPSGGRFFVVANTFMIPFFIFLVAELPEIGETILIKVFTVPLLIFFCLVNIRIGMDHFNLMAIIGNPISAALYSNAVSVIEDLKSIF